MELQRPERISLLVSALAILAAQLAAPAVVQALPDIEIRAKVRADRVEIERAGQAQLVLRVEPGAIEPARVERSAPPGQNLYRNLVIDVEGKAYIAVPSKAAPTPPNQETAGNTE